MTVKHTGESPGNKGRRRDGRAVPPSATSSSTASRPPPPRRWAATSSCPSSTCRRSWGSRSGIGPQELGLSRHMVSTKKLVAQLFPAEGRRRSRPLGGLRLDAYAAGVRPQPLLRAQHPRGEVRLRRAPMGGEDRPPQRVGPFPRWERVAALILDYRSRLLDAGIPMPDVVHWRIDGDAIVYRCEDGGANLVERHPRPRGARPRGRPRRRGRARHPAPRLGRGAPHRPPRPRTSSARGDDLRYVDFSPPLVSAYVEARCAAAAPGEERILRENFLYFTPEHLPYHFAGDLLNVGPSAGALFPRAPRDARGCRNDRGRRRRRVRGARPDDPRPRRPAVGEAHRSVLA